MTIPLGLSFDDVLLIPQLTPLASRSLAETAAWITPSLKLKIPFLSANMDTITDSKMAIALGKLPVAAAVGVNGMAGRGIYRGSSTIAAARARGDRGDRKNVADQWSRVEGVEARVPFKGPLAPIIEQFLGGLRSGMSYAGARNLAELQKNAQFIRITPAALRENHPHDVIELTSAKM